MVKLKIKVQRRDSELSMCVIFCVKNNLNTISTHHISHAVILVFFCIFCCILFSGRISCMLTTYLFPQDSFLKKGLLIATKLIRYRWRSGKGVCFVLCAASKVVVCMFSSRIKIRYMVKNPSVGHSLLELYDWLLYTICYIIFLYGIKPTFGHKN